MPLSTLFRRLAPFLLLGLLTQTGCLLHSPEMDRTHEAFQRQYPTTTFDRDIVLDFGPLSMAMAAGLTRRWAPDAFETAGPYFQYARRLEVGIYSVRDLPSLKDVDDIGLPVLQGGGWETVVRVREEDEHIWVMAQSGRAPLEALYILVLGEDELVSVRAEGDFGKMLLALTEHSVFLDDD